MSRVIDPMEAKVMLKKHQPALDQMMGAELADTIRWQNEIAMLERRVNTLYVDVDLGNGDKIAVRTALSEEESAEYNALELSKKDASIDEQGDIAYRQLELITANPLLTADWFRENKDKWPVMDALAIASSFLENQLQQRQNKVSNLQRFRGQ